MNQTTPTGGQLLGRLISAFEVYGLIDPSLRESLGKTSQRFFATGCPIDHACGPVCVLSWVFVGSPNCSCEASPNVPELFEPILFSKRPPVWLSRLLSLSVHAHAIAWDRLQPLIEVAPDLRRAFLRFGVLDLALKTAAFRRREGLAAPNPSEAPAWAEPGRLGEPVRAFIDGLEDRRLEPLAKRVGVSVDTIKRWRRGERRPFPMNIAALVGVLPREARAPHRAALSRHYALASLARTIADEFGEAALRESVSAWLSVVVASLGPRPAIRIDPTVLDMLDNMLIGFSSWITPPSVFVQIAKRHAPGWADDVCVAAELWRPLREASLGDDPVLQAIDWACSLHGDPPFSERLAEHIASR